MSGGSSSSAGRTYSVQAETTVTTGALSGDEFFARARKMCMNRQTLIRNRFRNFRVEREPGSDLRSVITDAMQSLVLPGIQFMFDDLRLIGAPSGDEDQLEETVGAFQFAIETGQARRISSAAQFAKLFQVFNRLADAFGIDQCVVNEAHYPDVWRASREAGRRAG